MLGEMFLTLKPRGVKPNDYIDTDRHPDHWPFRLTERDRRLLEHFYVYDGVLADYQVQALEFNSLRRAQDRLGKLFHNGFLARTNARGRASYGCMIYWLAEPGAEEVAAQYGQSLRELKYLVTPRWSQVNHDVLVNDFLLTVQAACAQSDELTLYEWINESTFRADPDEVKYITLTGKQEKRRVIPDRYLVIDRTGEKVFRSRLLVELDHSTHPNPRFANEKVLAGLAYLRSEAYMMRFGSQSGRWLIVTTGEKRLRYLKETTERAAGRDAVVFYFTTFDRVSSETVLTGEIWQRGGDDAPVALFPPR